MPKISVILPSRNEEDNIPLIIPTLLRFYKKYIFEIIVVDDCSSDNTRAVVENIQKKYTQVRYIRRIKNPGVGNTLKEGIDHVSPKSDYILFMDCDFIFNVVDISAMMEKIKKCDGVVGSRFMKKESLIHYPRIKRIANRLYHFLIRLLFRYPHKDVTNNLKLYKKDLVSRLTPILQSHDFAINAELGYFPLLLGAKIIEVPVHWRERSVNMGLSKFRIFLVGPSYLRVLLRLIKYSIFPSNILRRKGDL